MNAWVVFDPLTGGYRVYDLDAYRYNADGSVTTGYVSPPGNLDEARAARREYEASTR